MITRSLRRFPALFLTLSLGAGPLACSAPTSDDDAEASLAAVSGDSPSALAHARTLEGMTFELVVPRVIAKGAIDVPLGASRAGIPEDDASPVVCKLTRNDEAPAADDQRIPRGERFEVETAVSREAPSDGSARLDLRLVYRGNPFARPDELRGRVGKEADVLLTCTRTGASEIFAEQVLGSFKFAGFAKVVSNDEDE